MIIPFKYYLHDTDFHESFEDLIDGTRAESWSDEAKEELRQKMGRPFYEVTLECLLDTDSGEVTLVKAKL